LHEALRIHGGPAWRVFQVRCFFLLLFFPHFFAQSSWRGAYVSWLVGDRSSSTASAISTAPLIR
jgi:hypothetical protein